MGVTIRNLLDLDIMRDFKVAAGEKGLDREISSTEILDFEFIDEGQEYREKSFEGDSLVLSSLLFAKDRPELILESVKRLIAQNVQALAYKPVFFKTLPKEALAYAEERKFPILEFGCDEFFEDIIFSVKMLIEKEKSILHTESLFADMLKHSFSAEAAAETMERINPLLRPFGAAVCIRVEQLTENQVADVLRRGHSDHRLRSRTYTGKMKDKIFVILSQDEPDRNRFRAQLDDVLLAYGLMGREMTVGVSAVRRIGNSFDQAVRQAFWAEKIAEIEKKPVRCYKDLGIYKLIISNIHHKATAEYMEEYLGPLFAEEERDGELLRTAVEYILAGGDTVKTAERLFCHKNTIRYRIGKLQEKLDPESSEKDFYQNLASAVKIYLLIHEKTGGKEL